MTVGSGRFARHVGSGGMERSHERSVAEPGVAGAFGKDLSATGRRSALHLRRVADVLRVYPAVDHLDERLAVFHAYNTVTPGRR